MVFYLGLQFDSIDQPVCLDATPTLCFRLVTLRYDLNSEVVLPPEALTVYDCSGYPHFHIST